MNIGNNQGIFTILVKRQTGLTPLMGVSVQIASKGTLVSSVYTDINGTASVVLPSGSYENSMTPGKSAPYIEYDIKISFSGFIPVMFRGVQIFPGITTSQEYNMKRTYESPKTRMEIVNTPSHRLALKKSVIQSPAGKTLQAAIYPTAKEVRIPENITVHLGAPSDKDAENVTVPYIDYLKSVASSEIYPTWPIAALKANVLAQTTLALNRIYTEWYKTQGYDFDITSSPAYDQYYVHNRSTFDTTNGVVDETFTEYIARTNHAEPIFSKYCDGYITTCSGLSQWGSVELAEKYYTPLDILRYYYGNDVYIKEGTVTEVIPSSFPGTLKEGDTSESVAILQNRINRIAISYPSIPFIRTAEGTYNQSTAEAVRRFQEIFGLEETGETDEKTWYRVLYVYTAVKKLAESDSEGERTHNDGYPGEILNIGSRGLDVLRIQFYLKELSKEIGNQIPDLKINGVYDIDTRDAVYAFQKFYGILPTGVIDKATWDEIVAAYYNLPQGESPEIPPYPGKLIKYGDTGETVKYIQTVLASLARDIKEIPSVEADGIFGNLTKNSVMAFQRYYGLEVDGIVGKNTWEKLSAEYINAESGRDLG